MGIIYQAQKYSVKLTTEPIGGEEGERSFLAQMDEAGNSIVVDGTMPKSRQEECLLHELIHLADMAMPEFAVSNLGRSLYGLLRENSLLVKNILDKVVDGHLTRAEAEALNKASNKMAQGPTRILGRQVAPVLRVSEAPWDGSASRYTIEQWRRACLIHLDDVDPDLKGSHKLPVREPDGDISRNGAHSASAILGGGRGGVDAPMPQKRSAARALVRIYRNDLKEDPPTSLTMMAG